MDHNRQQAETPSEIPAEAENLTTPASLVLSMELKQNVLQQYANAFEQIDASNYQALLAPLLDDQVFFKDPFNQLVGKKSMFAVFEQMYQVMQEPKFSIQDVALGKTHGYIHWDFNFVLKQTPYQICGLSQISINNQGKVFQHIDFWDTGEYLYDKIPVISSVLRLITRKLRQHQ